MKKTVSTPAIVGVVALFAVVLLGAFMKFGNAAPPAKSEVASPYATIGDRPKSAGSGINSLTGEPLSATAKSYEEKTFASQTGKEPIPAKH